MWYFDIYIDNIGNVIVYDIFIVFDFLLENGEVCGDWVEILF